MKKSSLFKVGKIYQLKTGLWSTSLTTLFAGSNFLVLKQVRGREMGQNVLILKEDGEIDTTWTGGCRVESCFNILC